MDAAWKGMHAAWSCTVAENFSNGEPFRGMSAALSCKGGDPSSALDPLGAWLQVGFASAPLTESKHGSSLVVTFKKLQMGAWRCQDERAKRG
jgi:hypothetical protein